MSDQHKKLDKLKLLSAIAILEENDLAIIRARSLDNLNRRVSNGTWVSAFDEWRVLMTTGSDEELVAIMIGLDERSNRLRQSPPYAGLIKPDTRTSLLKAAGLQPPSKKAKEAAERFLAEELSRRENKR